MEGKASIALHIFTMVSNFELTKPRSIKLTVVRSQSASWLTLSCEIPLSFLIARKASPKAFSGPSKG